MWKETGKRYYGVRFAKDCDPTDLWNPYKTSSKFVREEVDNCGDPDIIQIHKTFETQEEAREYETTILSWLNVTEENIWLNATDNIAIKSMPGEMNPMYGKCRIGEKRNPNTGKNISEGLKSSNKVKERFLKSEKHPMYGKKHTEKTKELLSVRAKERFSDPTNNPMFGKTHTEETKQKLRIPKSSEHIEKMRLSQLGKRKYTNGAQTKMYHPGNEPLGWYKK
jgi:hypothetical protein